LRVVHRGGASGYQCPGTRHLVHRHGARTRGPRLRGGCQMKTVVRIPAYNAAKTITGVIDRIPKGTVDEVIVVNDGSADNTQEVLERIPSIRVIAHPQNRGYGAAQITLYNAAIEAGAEAIAFMHADGGHFPE